MLVYRRVPFSWYLLASSWTGSGLLPMVFPHFFQGKKRYKKKGLLVILSPNDSGELLVMPVIGDTEVPIWQSYKRYTSQILYKEWCISLTGTVISFFLASYILYIWLFRGLVLTYMRCLKRPSLPGCCFYSKSFFKHSMSWLPRHHLEQTEQPDASFEDVSFSYWHYRMTK